MSDFDPNEKIEIGEVEKAEEEEISEDSQKELKESSFGVVDIQNFEDFNKEDYVPQEGEYKFSVEQKFLKVATSITRLTASGSASSFGACKITLFNNKIKVSSFNQINFSEVFVPLHENLEPAQEETEKEKSFIFDHNILAKISQRFSDSIITFIFNAEKSLLMIKSGKSELQLSTYPETDFTAYHSKIGETEHKGKIDTNLFRTAIKYISQFVKKNDVQLTLSIAELRDGYLTGGNNSSIGVFKSPKLEGINVKIKYEVLSILEKILPHFHGVNTHLFETDSFFILRDENLYFGFEKVIHSFPPVDDFFKSKTKGYKAIIPREELLNSLHKLSVVSINKDLLVKGIISGNAAEAELQLITKDTIGRQSTDSISINKQSTSKEVGNSEFNLNITNFIKLVTHFNSANIVLEEIKKAIKIKDEGEDFEAFTFLTMLEEETDEE